MKYLPLHNNYLLFLIYIKPKILKSYTYFYMAADSEALGIRVWTTFPMLLRSSQELNLQSIDCKSTPWPLCHQADHHADHNIAIYYY